MIRLLIAATLIATSFFANAEVKRIGQFVPKQCSVREKDDVIRPDIVAVDRVCLGEIAHMKQTALSVSLNDGAELVYIVKFTKDDMRIGATTRKFVGQLSTMQSRDTALTRDKIEGEIVIVVSPKAKPTIEFKTGSNLRGKFELETVFTTL